MGERSARIAVVDDGDLIGPAVQEAGGEIAPATACSAVIWNGGGPRELDAFLVGSPSITWVQLCSAGVDAYLPIIDSARIWTRVYNAFGPQVAEHVLALLLTMFRRLHTYARNTSWSVSPDGPSLFGANIMIVGAGSIASHLIALLAPFEPNIYVVRRGAEKAEGATLTIRSGALLDHLPEMDAVVLAAPLTAETRGMIGARELQAMPERAVLVNVGRGGLVKTPDLVRALRSGQIAAAALDVTDPEPLPDAHPLWGFENCLITPHIANPPQADRLSTARAVADNVRRYLAGQPLQGIIDRARGY